MPISLAHVETVLREEDVEGLIATGSPDDEYDSEAKQITSALLALRQDQFVEKNVAAVVSLIWAKSFGQSSKEIKKRMPAFQKIAQRILA